MVGDRQQAAVVNLQIIGKRLLKLGQSQRRRYEARVQDAVTAQSAGDFARSIEISNKLLEDIPNA